MCREEDRVLEFLDVRMRAGSSSNGDACGVNLHVDRSDLILVLLEGGSENFPLYDLAEGLITPDNGSINFLGECWSNMTRFHQSAMRGRIGRVFETQGWVSNLSVYENIALSQQHHTSRSERDIREEIERLARIVGLDVIPEQRPYMLRRHKLKVAEWVRAFLGSPALVLLERPEYGVPTEKIGSLIETIAMAQAGGTAVVWMTSDAQIWRDSTVGETKRYKLSNMKLTSAMETE